MNVRSEQAPEVSSNIPFYVFYIKLSLSSKTFPYSLLERKCGALEMLLPNFDSPHFLAFKTNVFPVQKPMLLLKTVCYKGLGAISVVMVAGVGWGVFPVKVYGNGHKGIQRETKTQSTFVRRCAKGTKKKAFESGLNYFKVES